MKERFVSTDFRGPSLAIIDQANAIIEEYAAQGFTLTLRQLYYQFVARDLIRNTSREYHRLGSIINKARMAGLIDWDSIEDRTRRLRAQPRWDSPQDIIHSVVKGYAIDLWADQPYRPEVWIEKDALVGIIEGVCNRWQVPFFACRGYTSQSEQYKAGKRLQNHADLQQTPIIFHLGDHDPSGIDMTRDNDDRLNIFSGSPITVVRLALNIDQVRQYNPPPNPSKETDSRSASYRQQFGMSCWELDALDPRVIEQLIEKEIKRLLNRKKWAAAQARMTRERQELKNVESRWDEVQLFLSGEGGS